MRNKKKQEKKAIEAGDAIILTQSDIDEVQAWAEANAPDLAALLLARPGNASSAGNETPPNG
jgi:hypothetical protein